MIELGQLLGKFEELLLKGESGKEAVQKTLLESIGLHISRDKINIRDGVIYLDIKPIYRNEILIKKDIILAKLKEYGSSSRDIR